MGWAMRANHTDDAAAMSRHIRTTNEDECGTVHGFEFTQAHSRRCDAGRDALCRRLLTSQVPRIGPSFRRSRSSWAGVCAVNASRHSQRSQLAPPAPVSYTHLTLPTIYSV